MKKQLFAAMVLALASASAMADGSNHHNGIGNSSNDATATANSSSFGYGVGIGSGYASNANDIRNTNTNSNTNLQGQLQAQGQYQSATGGSASASNTNTNTANGGVGVGIGGSATIQRGAVQNSVTANPTATASAVNEGNNSTNTATASNNSSNGNVVNIAAPKTYRPPVSSAVAPTVFPTAPCMGSSSAGVQSTLFGISGGSSWESKECMILETARNFEQAGYAKDALAVRCQGKYAKVAPSCKALDETGELAAPDTKVSSGNEVRATPAAFPGFPMTQLDAVETF